jgi:hypothetical protein
LFDPSGEFVNQIAIDCTFPLAAALLAKDKEPIAIFAGGLGAGSHRSLGRGFDLLCYGIVRTNIDGDQAA